MSVSCTTLRVITWGLRTTLLEAPPGRYAAVPGFAFAIRRLADNGTT